MPLALRRFDDVNDFLTVAGPFLAAREAEHNLIFGVCSNLRDMPESFSASPYMAVVTAGDRVVATALQTPPFQLILSEIDDPAATAVLARDVLDRDLPGVVGPVEHVGRFVEEWTALGGRPGNLRFSERIFRLARVIPPRPVAGRARLAEPSDRDLIAAWLDAFMREALGEAEPMDIEGTTDRWLARRGRTLHLWEDREVVSLAGIGSPTPNGIRVGPVYTPPAMRGRGYASALVAAASQGALDAGRRFCFLFTNLANPTANHIYQAIGYEPIRDVDAWRFDLD